MAALCKANELKWFETKLAICATLLPLNSVLGNVDQKEFLLCAVNN